jgi:hypothetical protein
VLKISIRVTKFTHLVTPSCDRSTLSRASSTSLSAFTAGGERLWRFDYTAGKAIMFASEPTVADLNQDGSPTADASAVLGEFTNAGIQWFY